MFRSKKRSDTEISRADIRVVHQLFARALQDGRAVLQNEGVVDDREDRTGVLLGDDDGYPALSLISRVARMSIACIRG